MFSFPQVRYEDFKLTHTDHSSFPSFLPSFLPTPASSASLPDSIFCAFWIHFLVMLKIELFLPHSIFIYILWFKFARSLYYPLLACMPGCPQIIDYWNTTTLALFSQSDHHTHGRPQTQRPNQLCAPIAFRVHLCPCIQFSEMSEVRQVMLSY
jgi:hypothetical protein